jgi:hypothetical protein
MPTLQTLIRQAARRAGEAVGQIYRTVSRAYDAPVRLTGGWGSTAAISQEPPVEFDGRIRGIDPYDWRDALYSGVAYQPTCYGGGLKGILRTIGQWNDREENWETKNRIVPTYNAFRSIVDVYQHALSGKLGDGLEIDETANGEPVHEALPDLIGRVWRWSNLDSQKDPLITTVANQGTAGIRVVFDPDAGRVYLKWDDPKRIDSVETDAAGNVKSVRLKYPIPRYDEDGRKDGTIQVEEYFDQQWVARWEDNNEILSEQTGLGICPYALMAHRPVKGSAFGAHAYAGSEPAVHLLNWGLSQLGDSVW